MNYNISHKKIKPHKTTGLRPNDSTKALNEPVVGLYSTKSQNSVFNSQSKITPGPSLKALYPRLDGAIPPSHKIERVAGVRPENIVALKTKPAMFFRASLMAKITRLAQTWKKLTISINKFSHIKTGYSFSYLKKNFFKFGLEFIFLILIIFNAAATIKPEGGLGSLDNGYLALLLRYPKLNKNLVEQLKTQNIGISHSADSFVNIAQAASLDPLSASGSTQLLDKTAIPAPNSSSFLVSEDSVIIKPNFATKDAAKKRDIENYTVQNGDSISKIAANFGVSLQTIMYENKLSDTDYIKPGQVLTILPTTGLKHTVKSGETVEGIAKKYQVDPELVLEFNEIEDPSDIEAGEILIIPDAKIQIPAAKKEKIASYSKIDVKQALVPDDFVGGSEDLVWPVPMHTITQYFSSKHKALDISNGQRPQFWAAQAGIVELSGWQAGYGQTIVINHGNGLKTRYAHASELYVSAGDHVEQNQTIGRVGNTGRVFGATGNHLHYEVIKNGVKVDPLKYAK